MASRIANACAPDRLYDLIDDENYMPSEVFESIGQSGRAVQEGFIACIQEWKCDPKTKGVPHASTRIGEWTTVGG